MILDRLTTLAGYPITKVSDILIQGFTGSADSSMTGSLFKLDNVYSITQGSVIDISKDRDNLYVVTVLYGTSIWIRYCLLKSVNVIYNQYISPNDSIGITDRSNLRLEYCTPIISKYPVRLHGTTFYKHDPMTLLYTDGEIFSIPNSTVILEQ